MIYDAFTLAACVREMQAVLPGMIVHQVRQPHDLTLVLVCRTPGHQAEVTLSAHPRYARAHLSTVREPLPKTPPGFCQLLRKHLEGARVGPVAQEGLDRILTLAFHREDGTRLSLVHEMMGRHSNTILVSADRRILGALKVVPERLSRVRQILPGHPYEAPPAGRVDPRGLCEGDFQKLWEERFPGAAGAEGGAAQKWLISTFSGLGPTLAAEVLARARGTGGPLVYESLQELLRVFEAGTFCPVVIHYPGKPYEEVYPFPLESLPSEIQHSRARISEALEATVRAEMAGAALESAREELMRLTQKSRLRLEADRDDAMDILEHPKEGEHLRQTADLLSGSFHLIPHGKESVRLPDYYDAEMREVDIALRPDLSPKENVQRYYKLAKKAEERYLSARERLPQIRGSLERLQQTEEALQQAGTLEDFRSIRSALQNARLIQPEQVAVPKDREERPFGGYRIRSITSTDGLEILYGETAEANDYLTTRLARPGDIWMHARSVTGAHVVIRLGGARDAPPRTIREAADVAARHSDARHSSYIPVDWTLKKYVRKGRRSAPGFVTYTNEKTVHVTR